MKMKTDIYEVKLLFKPDGNFCLNVFVIRFTNFIREHLKIFFKFLLSQGSSSKKKDSFLASRF